ncbi:unnamed protein product [Protopolystoma xenopodis]|uniref:26S proteasome regulatory subunit Rpn6 N-terminal domain-containing protein n=1 Tax=Protopolystoma xenopodis TaxID=117903 RepID=A0A448X910_9PLAT|nr:unnamed protein product [Protopolystoma xenopodis]
MTVRSATLDNEEVLSQISELEKIVDSTDESAIKEKEQSILDLGNLLAKTKNAPKLADLIQSTRQFLQQISKAKAGRLVRELVNLFLELEGGTGREIELCKDCIEWANAEKRVFLRQALEAKLMALYYKNSRYEEALKLGMYE